MHDIVSPRPTAALQASPHGTVATSGFTFQFSTSHCPLTVRALQGARP